MYYWIEMPALQKIEATLNLIENILSVLLTGAVILKRIAEILF